MNAWVTEEDRNSRKAAPTDLFMNLNLELFQNKYPRITGPSYVYIKKPPNQINFFQIYFSRAASYGLR